jgi:hypothetical protein
VLTSVDEKIEARQRLVSFLREFDIPFVEGLREFTECYIEVADYYRPVIEIYNEHRMLISSQEEKFKAVVKTTLKGITKIPPSAPPPVGLPAKPKFHDKQLVRILPEFQGRGKVHPFGDRIWYVQYSEDRGGRYDYHCKLAAEHNSDIPVAELTRKAAWCMESELYEALFDGERIDGQKYGPEMKKVESTNVDSIGYTHTTQTLRVKFTNGDVYDYEQVPPDIAEGLQTARSPGGFLAAHIKGSFKYKKL